MPEFVQYLCGGVFRACGMGWRSDSETEEFGRGNDCGDAIAFMQESGQDGHFRDVTMMLKMRLEFWD
jgi:hypothetical protein